MSIINRINLNHLRIFEVVYRSQSMTEAAKELHLTQSGISQHIKSLESNLGVKLFDRYKQKILPTPSADLLFEKSSKNLDELEKCLSLISGTDSQLMGSVKIGTAMEFGKSVLLPLAGQFLKDHPLVQVKFRFGLSHEMMEALVNGELDFAYVDELTRDRRVLIDKVHEEPVELIASNKFIKSIGRPSHKKAFYDSLSYVSYLEGEPELRSWFKHHLKLIPTLNVRAYCSSPTGLLKLVQEDLGVGAVPRYMLKNLPRSAMDKITVLGGSGKDLMTSIGIAYLAGKSHSRAAVEFSKVVAQRLGHV